jgi:hypothetical protein
VGSDHGEVMHRDPTAFMRLPDRQAGVGLLSAEDRAEVFDLLGFHPLHIRSGVEVGQQIVVEHAAIEVFDDDFEGVVTADLVVERGGPRPAKSCEHAHADSAPPHHCPAVRAP